MAITVLLKPPIIQLNIIHNIDRGLQERNLSFLVITEYRKSFPNVSGITDMVIFHLNILDGVKRRYKDTNDY